MRCDLRCTLGLRLGGRGSRPRTASHIDEADRRPAPAPTMLLRFYILAERVPRLNDCTLVDDLTPSAGVLVPSLAAADSRW